MYNNSTTIEFIPAATFIKDYHSRMYNEEEQLLDVFFRIIPQKAICE